VQVAGECFRHLDTLGPDERKGDAALVSPGSEPARAGHPIVAEAVVLDEEAGSQ
jgi:hypothetical protein